MQHAPAYHNAWRPLLLLLLLACSSVAGGPTDVARKAKARKSLPISWWLLPLDSDAPPATPPHRLPVCPGACSGIGGLVGCWMDDFAL